MITTKLTDRKPADKIHLKYIDDMSVAESINLKQCLRQSKDDELQRPLEFHDRTEHVLPTEHSQVQRALNDLKMYCKEKEMTKNEAKCNAIQFNTSRLFDFTPGLTLSKNVLWL